MLSQRELFVCYSEGILSMSAVMDMAHIHSKDEFVNEVRRHKLPFAIFKPDARPMIDEEKQEFFKRYINH